jgi:cytochrome c oxidase subunit II
MTTNRAPRIAALAALALAALASGCGGALDPRGEGAQRIADLWWVMFWLSLLPLAIVTAALIVILIRRRRENRSGAGRPEPDLSVSERLDRRVILLGGVVLPILLLLPTAAMTLATGWARDPGTDPEPLEIEVTGHQFWWELRYPPPGSNSLDDPGSFRTANEVHIPVGRPVEIVARSDDVIHSFWAPQLDGKIDLIPGRTNRLRIQASEPGRFEGRCAEFCGLGHALMRFFVVAHPEEEFEDWHEAEAADTAVEIDADTRELFADGCGPCHDLRGIAERDTFRGDFGPDLTHVGSRTHIAAGLLPNTPGALARWIVDPERVKPGSRMPYVGLEGSELNDLVELLGSLRHAEPGAAEEDE